MTVSAADLAKLEFIAASDPRFPVAAYVLVLDGFALARRNAAEKSNITAASVVTGVITEAAMQFGPMAPLVVAEIGLRTSIAVVAAIERLVAAKLLAWGPRESLQSVVGAVSAIDFMSALDESVKIVFAADPPRMR